MPKKKTLKDYHAMAWIVGIAITLFVGLLTYISIPTRVASNEDNVQKLAGDVREFKAAQNERDLGQEKTQMMLVELIKDK